MSGFGRLLPAILAVLCVGWLGGKLRPPTDDPGELKAQAFGRLPVVYNGRVKPFDTLARNSLIIISDRQSWIDEDGDRQPAIRWLLDVISNSTAAEKHKVFRIANLQLQSTLGLERRKGYRYAHQEFVGKLHTLEQHADRARSLERAQRDVYDNKVLELTNKVTLYTLLREAHAFPHVRRDAEHFQQDLMRVARRWKSLERFPLPHAIPPHAEGQQWRPFMQAILEAMATSESEPPVEYMGSMLTAWSEGDTETFNGALARYETFLARHKPANTDKLDFEVLFNHFEPFYHCSVLYVIAFVLGAVGWLGWGRTLNRAAFWLMIVTACVHTFALAARVHISGYPPITNLYGTAVFIGWGCVLLGLILEGLYRLGIGNIIASVSGFLTLLIAHFLAGDGDTLEMMQAVLDTKFWLATHVVIINLGYTATFVAGGLAVVYILRGVLTRSLPRDAERAIGKMIYGIVCFALLLSFVGTVLGGLWADDSWGRFWGWDPKENGALLIVLWNALILHARWGGMVKTRGIAVLAVFGGIVTSWSWFGVNQLGVGLHSYGFTESVAFWLVIFVSTQLAVMAIGLLPHSKWRSVRARDPFETDPRGNGLSSFSASSH